VIITIDGQEYEAQAGQTILEVARENGVSIPTLCEHARIANSGRCRVCVVEVEGMRGGGLKASCVLEAQDGMVVKSEQSDLVERTRRMVVELMLASGKHDCLVCEKNGACELQEVAYSLGIETPSFEMECTAPDVDDSSEGIIRDPSKCIHCGRCIDTCNNNVMHEVMNMGARGAEAYVICDNDKTMKDSGCVQCGECSQVCPVGALVYKTSKNKARQWEVEKKRVVCPYCGVGCIINMAIKDGKYVWAEGVEEGAERMPNKGMLCVKGRFGMDYINREDRLTTPLIRKDGKLEPASWDEALDLAASKLKELKDTHGASALGCFSSAKTTNEENYAMMRFARGVLGTNNVDHCARLCHSSTVAGLATTLGSGAMTNSMQEAEKSDVILITGSNTTWCHPVFGGMIKKAVKQSGVKLVVVDPRETDLAKVADLHVRQRGGSDVAWLMGVQNVIVSEGWHDEEYVAANCEGWDEYKKALEFYTPEKVEELSGIAPEQIREIARLYATSGVGAIYYSMGITQHSHGVDNVKAIANLALITANLGKPGGGVNPLRGQSNVQGACDMGALPNVFSGYQPVISEEARAKFAKGWGIPVEGMDAEIGETVTTMVDKCGEKIKGLYVMGENPMVADPDLNHVEEQIEKLDLLIVQDIFLTETAEKADIVFPGSAFAETAGAYTNTERRVQYADAAVEAPGQAKPDYWIIAELAKRLGCENFPNTPESIFAEIKELTPSYHGMTKERLVAEEGLRWPCPSEDHPGTPILHVGKPVRGKGLLSALEYRAPMEEPCELYPLRLATGRMLQHFHTGTMSRRSVVLDGIVPKGSIEVNPVDADALGIENGELIKVSSRRGSIETAANVTPDVAEGTLYMAFHFAEAAANRLTNNALDPVAKIPEYKVCAAKIEKL
jgi:formate dehydrogenase (NADP+) alpha subunit